MMGNELESDLESDDDLFDNWIEDIEPIKCLFDNEIFPNLDDFLLYHANNYNFDLVSEIKNLNCLDEINLICLINFIREWTSSCDQNFQPIKEYISNLKQKISKKEFQNNEKYMKPFLTNDSLLVQIQTLCEWSDSGDDDIRESDQPQIPSTANVSEGLNSYEILLPRMLGYENSSSATDASYFESYSFAAIHETMLKDNVRMSAYSASLTSEYIRNKTVLDVGCGTSILCLLAARAGAKSVIGVECSKKIAAKALSIVAQNNLSSKISIVQGHVEKVGITLQSDEKVDILVSEWMGYGLYFENMLPSVLFARDKYLCPRGIILPSAAKLFLQGIGGCSSPDDRVKWWDNVNGFDFSDMADLVTSEAQVDLVDPHDVFTDRVCVHSLDISTAVSQDLDFNVSFLLSVKAAAELQAFVISFDTFFNDSRLGPEIILTTAVEAEPTHWKQTVLWIESQNRRHVTTSDLIHGRLTYERNLSNLRDYTIRLQWTISLLNSACTNFDEKFEYVQVFYLGS